MPTGLKGNKGVALQILLTLSLCLTLSPQDCVGGFYHSTFWMKPLSMIIKGLLSSDCFFVHCLYVFVFSVSFVILFSAKSFMLSHGAVV